MNDRVLAGVVVAIAAIAGPVAPAAAQPVDEVLCGPLLLCLSAPGGAGAHPECRSALEVLFGRLRYDQGFPPCPSAGVTVSPVGHSPYFDCDGGAAPATGANQVAMCESAAADGRPALTPARARPNPDYVDVRYASGFNVRLWFTRER